MSTPININIQTPQIAGAPQISIRELEQKIQEYVKNPNTGVNNVFPLLIGLVLSLAVLFVFRKNSVNQL